MSTGLYVGKFIPFHKGHQYMIDYAKERVDQLYVLVCSRQEHPFPAWERAFWIHGSNPGVNVSWVDTTDLDEWDSKLWAAKTIEWLGFVPDYTFTSEHYGSAWAHYMGSEHVLVDLDRKAVEISATKIREDPYGNWDLLTAGPKAKYAKKICIIGPESCGKTTLAANLAKHYDTSWVPEYGRIYGEERGFGPKEWEEVDPETLFRSIYIHQGLYELMGGRGANKFFFCDTDIMTTKVWYQFFYKDTERWDQELYEDISKEAALRSYDLYIVCAPTTDWIDDGTRNMGEQRWEMYWHLVRELSIHTRDHGGKISFINYPEYGYRTQKAIDVVDKALKEWGIT